MLISTSRYYEMYIKGKDAKHIAKEVEELRRGINSLKRRIESPSYRYEEHMAVSELSQIKASREYLDAAVSALRELGAYEPTEEEIRAAYVESKNPQIVRLTLTAGVYLEKQYTVDISENSAKLTVSVLHGKSEEEPIDLSLVRRTVDGLHIGEWRDAYFPEDYGCSFSEAERWQLRIDYSSDIAPAFFDGHGVYPYNFEELAKIMKYVY